MFIGKYLSQSSPLNKIAALKAFTFLKNGIQHRCPLVNIAKFRITPILTNTCERLLLEALEYFKKQTSLRRMKDIFHGGSPSALRFLFLANPLSFLLHKLKGNSCANVRITVLHIISSLISFNYMLARLMQQSSHTTQ